MSQRLEQTPYQRRHKDGKQGYEKISISYVTGEMQNKRTRYHETPTFMTKILNTDIKC